MIGEPRGRHPDRSGAAQVIRFEATISPGRQAKLLAALALAHAARDLFIRAPLRRALHGRNIAANAPLAKLVRTQGKKLGLRAEGREGLARAVETTAFLSFTVFVLLLQKQLAQGERCEAARGPPTRKVSNLELQELSFADIVNEEVQAEGAMRTEEHAYRIFNALTAYSRPSNWRRTSSRNLPYYMY